MPPARGRSAEDPAVVERIASGDHASAAEQFVETVALGPGTWAPLPPDVRRTLIENAPTFLDEAGDLEQLAFDLDCIRGFSKPVLLTLGGQSCGVGSWGFLSGRCPSLGDYVTGTGPTEGATVAGEC